MKNLATVFAILFLGLAQSQAQNPYAALGIEEQVLHYDDEHKEVFDNDTIKPIGYALFDRKTGLIALYDLSDTLIACDKIDPSKVAKFLSVDPLTRDYPELTPYQFASNTPIQAIDLDGLEAWVAYRDYYGDTKTPVIRLVFDKELQPIGGVYEVSRHYDKSGFMEAARWGSTNYSDYSDYFPNSGNYWRADGKSLITFEIEGGLTYGHAAAEGSLFGKKAGFNFQAGNYLLGGSYNSSTGGTVAVLKTDEFNLVGEIGGGIGSLNIGSTYNPSTAEFSNTNGGFGLPIGDLDLKPTNSSISVGGNSKSTFIGPEMNVAMGVGLKLRFGASYNPQPSLTSLEKVERNALEQKITPTKEEPKIFTNGNN